MPLPRTVISGDMLKKRWNISSVGILFMLINHELNTATGNEYPFIIEKAHESEAIWLIIEDKFDPSGFLYWFDDVIRVETEYPELRLNDKIVYTVSELEMRWQVSDTEVFDIINNTGLQPVDPVGVELDSEMLDRLIIEHKCIKPQDFLYRVSDIENTELEFDIEHLESVQQADPKLGAAKSEKDEGVPVFSFFNNGDYWKIGIPNNAKDLKHLKGFDLISLLIEHEGKEIDSTHLDNLGKAPLSEIDGKELPRSGSRRFRETDENYGNEDGGLRIDGSFQDDVADERTIKVIKAKIDEINERMQCEIDPEKKVTLKEEKIEYQKYLSEVSAPGQKVKKYTSSGKEYRRQNVQKLIKKALTKIHSEVPELSVYLNKKTIKTGSACSYRPDPSNPVLWKLYPEE